MDEVVKISNLASSKLYVVAANVVSDFNHTLAICATLNEVHRKSKVDLEHRLLSIGMIVL